MDVKPEVTNLMALALEKLDVLHGAGM